MRSKQLPFSSADNSSLFFDVLKRSQYIQNRVETEGHHGEARLKECQSCACTFEEMYELSTYTYKWICAAMPSRSEKEA